MISVYFPFLKYYHFPKPEYDTFQYSVIILFQEWDPLDLLTFYIQRTICWRAFYVVCELEKVIVL